MCWDLLKWDEWCCSHIQFTFNWEFSIDMNHVTSVPCKADIRPKTVIKIVFILKNVHQKRSRCVLSTLWGSMGVYELKGYTETCQSISMLMQSVQWLFRLVLRPGSASNRGSVRIANLKQHLQHYPQRGFLWFVLNELNTLKPHATSQLISWIDWSRLTSPLSSSSDSLGYRQCTEKTVRNPHSWTCRQFHSPLHAPKTLTSWSLDHFH